ncbi:uncharacterized protein LOC123512028 [Portunus trituberculatus]|uniref:uncharacterized protein LOC123512028 n=1 Tax=Portunus trituberculatus TaxID=210409 RepID=UPI001E1CC512|nr:uncharacterized protein LOC123512028 [Portunus trituberculatus]
MERRQSLSKMIVHAFRTRMIWLWLAGLSAREISCCTGASVSTVYRWLRRWQAGDSLEIKNFKGRQPDRVLEQYLSFTAKDYFQSVLEVTQPRREMCDRGLSRLPVPDFPLDSTYEWPPPSYACVCNSLHVDKVAKACG